MPITYLQTGRYPLHSPARPQTNIAAIDSPRKATMFMETPKSYVFRLLRFLFVVPQVWEMSLVNQANVTLLTCLHIHFFIITANDWISHMLVGYVKISWTVSQGISCVLYLIFGWIADIRVTYYRMINMSFILVLISSLFMFALPLYINLLKHDITEHMVLSQLFNIGFPAIVLMVGIIGFGMYESNAIWYGSNA